MRWPGLLLRDVPGLYTGTGALPDADEGACTGAELHSRTHQSVSGRHCAQTVQAQHDRRCVPASVLTSGAAGRRRSWRATWSPCPGTRHDGRRGAARSGASGENNRAPDVPSAPTL